MNQNGGEIAAQRGLMCALTMGFAIRYRFLDYALGHGKQDETSDKATKTKSSSWSHPP